MSKLTDTFLRGLKATDKVQKHVDGSGLYLYVSPTGGKLWRMDYRFEGKRKTLSMGAYPAISLADARIRRQEAKTQIAKGIDPSTHKQAVKATVRAESANSYETVVREWHAKHSPGWTGPNSARTLARQEKDIFPILGAKPINQITAPELLAALRRIQRL